jgi:hypothetical protein
MGKIMNGRRLTVLFASLAAATVLLADADAGARERRSRTAPKEQTELDVSTLSPDAVRKSFLGTWNDELGRFWFTIDDIAGDQVRSAQFHLAHFKNGHIQGNRLTLVSASCIPLIGCYDYTIDGRLITLSRMDMRATDETGDTVQFILVRK